MTDISSIETLLALPATERLAIAEALWESLAAEPQSVPVPDWHRNNVEQRLDADDADADPGVRWTELRRRIEGQG